MKGEVSIIREYKITLDNEEAEWLRRFVQNRHGDQESEVDRDMRQRIWDSLDEDLMRDSA